MVTASHKRGNAVSHSSAAQAQTIPPDSLGAAQGETGVSEGDERWQMIARAAYFRAEQRGFAPGSELDDWLAAEAEIAKALGDKLH